MNETIQLLQDLVRNTQTGLDAVAQLLPMAESEAMRRELATQRDQYRVAESDAKKALEQSGGHAEPTGFMARAGMHMGITMDTLTDRSDAHLAEMLIQGATMGVVEMTKALNTYTGADGHARGLAGNFIDRQNDTVERLKSFLKDEARV